MLTKRRLRALAHCYKRKAGRAYRGTEYHIAAYANMFGTGDSEQAALADLCERLHVRR